MIEGKALQKLKRGEIRRDQLPIIIRRKWWIDLISLAILPVWVALALLSIWASITANIDPNPLGRVLLFLMGGICALVGMLTANAIFGYRLIVHEHGVTIAENFSTRSFRWDEITKFDVWPIPRLPGHQTIIYVDGSNNPKRIARNLYFAGHFVVPYLELRGKDLTRLLRRTKQALQKAETAS